MPANTKNCVVCGAAFRSFDRRRKTCSTVCANIRKDHTTAAGAARQREKYLASRPSVKNCVDCGKAFAVSQGRRCRCDVCQIVHRVAADRERHRRRQDAEKNKVRVCQVCSKEYRKLTDGGGNSYCTECQPQREKVNYVRRRDKLNIMEALNPNDPYVLAERERARVASSKKYKDPATREAALAARRERAREQRLIRIATDPDYLPKRRARELKYDAKRRERDRMKYAARMAQNLQHTSNRERNPTNV